MKGDNMDNLIIYRDGNKIYMQAIVNGLPYSMKREGETMDEAIKHFNNYLKGATTI